MPRLRARVTLAGCTIASLVVLAAVPAPPSAAGAEATVSAVVRINPLAVALDLPPREAFAGQQVRARATVQNLGVRPVTDVVVTIHVSEPTVTVLDGTERPRGTLAGDTRTQTSWQLCGTSPSASLVVARAEGRLDGATVVAHSPAFHLVVTDPPGRRPPTCR